MTRSLSNLIRDIEEAREEVLAVARALDPAFAEVPIAEGRWSRVQYLEHLVRAEETTLWRMFRAVDDARTRAEVIESPTPHESIEAIVGRTWAPSENAPPLAVPALGGPIAYWIVRLHLNSAMLAAFAEVIDSRDLDTVTYPHPISGPLTMRQGLEFVRFHMDRHREHLMSVSSDRMR